MRHQINISKTIAFIIVVTILQVMAMAALVIVFLSTADGSIREGDYIVLGLVCLSMLSSCLTLLNLAPIVRQNQEAEMLSQALAAVETLNRSQRAQRHDFLNHLQVVYSLIEMDEYKEAHDYIERIYTDIQRTTGGVRTDHPSVNAIMQAKLAMCESRGASVSLDITTRLEHLPIPAWELCRVIGNIIDNAITALAQNEGEKRLYVRLSESLKTYTFTFENNGPAIEPSLWQSIFEPGFSTNVGERGMGLAICRDIFRSCGGTLRVFSDKTRTVFEGVLPKLTSDAENDTSA
ncbi:MAG: Spo0B domain-containing protein [Clostridiaceae bacterium]|nr:Spo0B domain-containing protein [Clostridiaceae bacterium]